MSVFVIYPVGKGPFPLIVFSHGFNSVAEFCTRRSWNSSPGPDSWLRGLDFPSNDYRTHPADISPRHRQPHR